GLGHRYADLLVALVDLDRTIGLLEDDALEAFFVEGGESVLRALAAPPGVAGLARLEACLGRRLAVADLIAGSIRRLQFGMGGSCGQRSHGVTPPPRCLSPDAPRACPRCRKQAVR